MDVTVYEHMPKVDFDDTTLFSMVTTVPYVGWSLDEIGYVLHFDGNLTEAQIASVREVVYFGVEYSKMRTAGRNAITSNNAWISDVLPQIVNGCNTIINHSSSSAFDKDLARGLRTTANQVGDSLRQNNAIIRLILERL